MTTTSEWKPSPVGFKRFYTPQFGVVLFWLSAVPLLIAGGILLVQGSVVMGITMIASALFFRVFFETMTVLFQIHDVLCEIRDADKTKAAEAERQEKMARVRALAARAKPAQPGETRLDAL